MLKIISYLNLVEVRVSEEEDFYNLYLVAGDRYDQYTYNDKEDLLDHLDNVKRWYLDEYECIKQKENLFYNVEEFEDFINTI
ncbi:hypothetical protein ACVNNN_24790 [Lysinibacillus fusiformis]|uniref:hypothetical protein n=1 Tax=Lysinibacillus sp. PWR01 TaxID=3342384 RepID=UPI00372D0FDE